MAWDETDVRRYEDWFESAEGSFAFAQEVRLIERLMSSWPRRGQRLLDIGCGPGLFASVLHQDGFDVTGLDCSPVMLEAARNRLGDAVDLHLAQATHLPFDDREFDYCVLLTVLEFLNDPAEALREAARVARRGVLVGFLNRLSLYHLHCRAKAKANPGGTLSRIRWFSPMEIWALLRQNVRPCRSSTLSVLTGPPATWTFRFPFRQLNGLLPGPPLGAFCAVRLDFQGERPLTPLAAFTTEPSPG